MNPIAQTAERPIDREARLHPTTVELTREELPEWDAFVASHPHGTLHHLSSWITLLEESFGHMRGQILAVRDGESDEIVAGVPLYDVRSWLLGRRLVATPFATYCDPLVSSPEQIATLVSSLIQRSDDAGARFVQVRSRHYDSELQAAGMASTTQYKHHYIKIDRPLTEVQRACSRKAVRQKVSQAERRGIEVQQDTSADSMGTFYSMLCEGRRRLGLPPIPFAYFRALVSHCAPDCLDLFLARHEEQVVGGALSLKFNRTYTLEYSSEAASVRGWGVGQLLYWRALEVAHEEGYEEFSFGRTRASNAGLRAYKAHWRADEEDLPVFYYPHEHLDRRLELEGTAWYSYFRRIVSSVPEPVFRWLGKVCYHHVG